MDSGIRRTILGIAAFISIVLGLFVASVVLPQKLSDEQARQLGFFQYEVPRKLNDFSMIDNQGRNVSLESLRGRWSILFFGFTTCPDICPTTLSILSSAVKELEPAPRVVMVSVDPDRDTPEKLNQYVPAFHQDFMGYSGTFDETVAFAQQLNVAFGKVPGGLPGSYLVDHSASLILLNPAGEYTGFIKAPHNAQNIQKILRSVSR